MKQGIFILMGVCMLLSLPSIASDKDKNKGVTTVDSLNTVNLNWYNMSDRKLIENISGITRQAGPKRFCLMISEDVPPDWKEKVPLILEYIKQPSHNS